MGLQAQTSEVGQQGPQQVALSTAVPPIAAQRSVYGHPSPLGAQRTVSV